MVELLAPEHLYIYMYIYIYVWPRPRFLPISQARACFKLGNKCVFQTKNATNFGRGFSFLLPFFCLKMAKNAVFAFQNGKRLADMRKKNREKSPKFCKGGRTTFGRFFVNFT